MKDKGSFKKPLCPKCGSFMRLVSTGFFVISFLCPQCREKIVVSKEPEKNSIVEDAETKSYGGFYD